MADLDFSSNSGEYYFSSRFMSWLCAISAGVAVTSGVCIVPLSRVPTLSYLVLLRRRTGGPATPPQWRVPQWKLQTSAVPV